MKKLKIAVLGLALIANYNQAFATSRKFKTEQIQKSYERILETFPESDLWIGKTPKGEDCGFEIKVNSRLAVFGDVTLPTSVDFRIHTVKKDSSCETLEELKSNRCYSPDGLRLDHNKDQLRYVQRVNLWSIQSRDFMYSDGGMTDNKFNLKLGLNSKGEIISASVLQDSKYAKCEDRADSTCETGKSTATCYF